MPALPLAALLVAASAIAAPRDFVMVIPGGAGSTEEAKPYVEKFLRHVEAKLGWPAGSASGAYFTDVAEAAAHIESQKPGFGMIGLGMLAERRDATPIATVEMIGEPLPWRYHLVARAGATLASVRGGALITNHMGEAPFLSRAAFGARVDLAKDFVASPTRQALKGVKAVARGEAAATVLDEAQWAHVPELRLGVDLVALLSSPPLPGRPIVAFEGRAKPADAKAVGEFLPNMCPDAAGAEICRTLRAVRFTPPDRAAYEALRKR